MKKNKIIRINLLINIAAVPNDAEAIEEQRRKEKALMDLCNKLEKEYKANGKTVEFEIIPYYDVKKRKKNKNELLLLIDDKQFYNLENEIGKAIEHLNNNFFVHLFNRIKRIIVPDKITTINLFVVCPKDALNNEKEQILKRCLEYNEKYAAKGIKFKINPVTYYDPENREDVSNNYIKNKADIVIFLVDKIIDDDKGPLVKNIKLAVDLNKTFQKPEPIVMVSNDKDNNTLETTKKILASGGWIPDPFNSTQELLGKVEDKLNRFIDSYKSVRKARRKSIWRYYSLRIGLPMIFALAIVSGFLWSKAESRRLLIVGGGSARSYIEDSLFHKNQKKNYLSSWTEGTVFQKKNSLSTLYWLYVAMPSGDSYRIMAEEIIKNYPDYKSRPFYPIVLSAQKASEKQFLRTSRHDEFKKTGIIIGIQIGKDYLVAYGSNNAIPDEMIISDTAILSTSIDSIIKKQLFLSSSSNVDSTTEEKQTVFYTTSENSGTLNSYFKVCDSLKLREYLSMCEASKEGRRSFSDIDTLPKEKNDSIWIVLGSKYYYPKNTIMKPLTVLNNEKKLQSKPIYIYFMMYKDEHHYTYVLPKATKGFIETIYNKQKNNRSNIESFDSFINRIYDTINNNHQNGTRILYDNFTISHEQ